MKFVNILFCYIFVFTISKDLCKSQNLNKLLPDVNIEPRNISQAIVYVVENFFAKRTSSIVLNAETITIDSEDYVMDIVDEVLRSINSVTVQLDLFSQLDIMLMRHFNVFFVDSYASFRTILSEMTEDAYDFTGYYLVYYSGNSSDQYSVMTKMFEDLWNILIVNVNIIVEPIPNVIQMYTYFPFNRFHCRQIGPTIINRFVNRKMVNDDLFPTKIKNFHKCPLNIYAWETPPNIFTRKQNGLQYIWGIEGNMLVALSEKLNFTINLVDGHNITERGDVYPNGTAYGTFSLLSSSNVDIIIGAYQYTNRRAQQFSASFSYYSTSVIFAVPPGAPYGSYEALHFPFDTHIWLSIGVSFMIGIGVIIVLRFMTKVVRPFVVGRRNPTPIFNMVITFLGGPVEPAPGRNFARFILTLWMIITIVLRSCYQSQFIYFIRFITAKSPPRKLSDLFDGNYTILIKNSYMGTMAYSPYIVSRSQEMIGSFQENIENLLVTKDKISVCCNLDTLTYFNTRFHGRGVVPMVRERLFQFVQCMYMKKFSYIALALDETLQEFEAAGLFEKWSLQYADERFNRPQMPNSVPTQLILAQYEGLYAVFGVLMAFSFIIFLLEVLALKFKFLKRILDLIEL